MADEFDEINKLLEDLDLDESQFAEEEKKEEEKEEGKEAKEEVSTTPSETVEEPSTTSTTPEEKKESAFSDLSFLEDLGTTAPSAPSQAEKKEETTTQPPAKEKEEISPKEGISEAISGLEQEPVTPVTEPTSEKKESKEKIPETPTPSEAVSTGESQPSSPLDEFSDEEITTIFNNIKSLRPILRKYVKEVILNDELSPQDTKTLLNYLLLNEDPDIIQAFIERKTGRKITPPKIAKKKEVPKKIGPSIFSVIANNLFPIIRLLIPLILIIYILFAFVFTPIINNHKAKSLIKEGIKLIYTDDIMNFDKAEKNFKKALSIKKKFYNAYIKYGDAYFKVKRLRRAYNKYVGVLKLKEDFIPAYFKLGELFRYEGKYKEAIKTFKKILNYDKNNIKALDKIARIYYYDLKDPQKAKKVYKDIIKNDPENIYAHYGLLSIYILDDDLENVEKEHYQVLKNSSKYIDLKRLTELARYYINYNTKGDYALRDDLLLKAEDTLKRILEKNPKYSEAYYEYARLQYKRKDVNNAILKVKEAIKYNNEVAKYHNFLGELYVDKKNFNLAIDEFNRAIEIDDNFAKAHYNLGNINYYGLENYDKALDEYLYAARQLKDEIIELDYNLGWIYYNKNDYIDADKWFNKAQEIETNDNPVIRYAKGNTYLLSKLYKNAIDEYKEAVDYFKSKYGEFPKINKENEDEVNDMEILSAIYNNLGVSYIYLNNETRALVYLWKAVESAKKIDYNNENAPARINIQYIFNSKKNKSVSTKPVIFKEIPRSISKSDEEKYKIF